MVARRSRLRRRFAIDERTLSCSAAIEYTQEELDHGKTAVDRQLAAYRRLVTAAAGAAADKEVESALGHLEMVFFTNMALVFDRYFVHRLRVVAGKDGNPLNEVEMIADSLMNNDGVLRGNNVTRGAS